MKNKDIIARLMAENEIKLRAWDKRKSEWLRHVTNELRISEEVMFNGKFYIEDSSLSGNDNVEIVLYSGRKDRTGKEIYSGDILQRYKKNGEPYKQKKVVGFVRNCFINCENLDESVVIGNIFENPELLSEVMK